MSDYDSAGVWIDSAGEPCLVLRLHFPDGTSSPRLLHERTCMGTFGSGGEQEPARRAAAAARGCWFTRPALPQAAGRCGRSSSSSRRSSSSEEVIAREG